MEPRLGRRSLIPRGHAPWGKGREREREGGRLGYAECRILVNPFNLGGNFLLQVLRRQWRGLALQLRGYLPPEGDRVNPSAAAATLDALRLDADPALGINQILHLKCD